MRGGGAPGIIRPAPRRVSATIFSAGKEGWPPRKGTWRRVAKARSPITTIIRSVGSDQEGKGGSGPDRGCHFRRMTADAPARASRETRRRLVLRGVGRPACHRKVTATSRRAARGRMTRAVRPLGLLRNDPAPTRRDRITSTAKRPGKRKAARPGTIA